MEKITADEFVKFVKLLNAKANIEANGPFKTASDMFMKLMKDVSDYAESKKKQLKILKMQKIIMKDITWLSVR